MRTKWQVHCITSIATKNTCTHICMYIAQMLQISSTFLSSVVSSLPSEFLLTIICIICNTINMFELWFTRMLCDERWIYICINARQLSMKVLHNDWSILEAMKRDCVESGLLPLCETLSARIFEGRKIMLKWILGLYWRILWEGEMI